MNYEKNVKLNGAILTQENLISLMKSAYSYFQNIRTSIKFTDNSNITGISVDEFEKMSFKNKKIKSFDIKSSAYTNNKQSSFWVQHDDFSNVCEIKFEFSDYDDYVRFADVIDNWRNEVCDRRKYINIIHSWGLNILFFLIAYIPLVFIGKDFNQMATSAGIWVFPSFGYASGLKALLKYAFPLTEIDIGINNRKTFRKFAWGLISLLIIPIILSLVF